VFAFVIGYGLTLLVVKVVDSAVSIIFVAFAQDPDALSTSKPELYNMFRETYPGLPVWAVSRSDQTV
jgi:hypothetical protein